MAKIKVENGNGNARSERVIKLELLCKLSPDEYENEAGLLAKEDLEILRIENEARNVAAGYRESIKLVKETRDPRAEVVSTHQRKQIVECIEEANFERNVIVTKRRDTGEHISERAMEAEERARMAQGKFPWLEAELPEKAVNDVEPPRPHA